MLLISHRHTSTHAYKDIILLVANHVEGLAILQNLSLVKKLLLGRGKSSILLLPFIQLLLHDRHSVRRFHKNTKCVSLKGFEFDLLQPFTKPHGMHLVRRCRVN